MRVKDFVATFTVPVTLDAYAPEVYYIREDNALTAPLTLKDLDRALELQLDGISFGAAGSIVEVDLLAPDGDPTNEADWRLARGTALTVTGLQDPLALAYRLGVRIRCKSAGAAGTTVADAAWWGE